MGQPLKERGGTARRDPRAAVQHQVLIEPVRVPLTRDHRDRDPRIASEVAQLPLFRERADDHLVILDAHPGERDVRRPVRVERHHVGERASRDDCADGVRDWHGPHPTGRGQGQAAAYSVPMSGM
jgi:hypothetical protein